eukprot:m.123754 g.123754  ORF g.123754 m.123754 type:complete len:480 (+) comp17279_c0_seq1:60-1499(+)
MVSVVRNTSLVVAIIDDVYLSTTSTLIEECSCPMKRTATFSYIIRSPNDRTAHIPPVDPNAKRCYDQDSFMEEFLSECGDRYLGDNVQMNTSDGHHNDLLPEHKPRGERKHTNTTISPSQDTSTDAPARCDDGNQRKKRRRVDAPQAQEAASNQQVCDVSQSCLNLSATRSCLMPRSKLSSSGLAAASGQWKCVAGLTQCQCRKLLQSEYFSAHAQRLTMIGTRSPEPTNTSGGNLLKCSCMSVTEQLLTGDAIGSLRKITSLHVERAYAPHMPACITSLSALTSLTWRCIGLTRLPPTLGRMQSLERLKLNVGQAWEIPGSLCECGNLQELFLHGHGNSEQLISIPEKLGKLSRLRTVHIECPVKSIPWSCGALARARINVKQAHGARPHLEFFVRLFDDLYWHLDYHHGFRWCCTVFMRDVVAAERRVAARCGVHPLPPEIWWQIFQCINGKAFKISVNRSAVDHLLRRSVTSPSLA